MSIGFRILISLHPAIQTTGRLTFAPAGLPPAEHTSLNWTHFRTAGFPQYGWKAGFPSGAFLDDQRLKPALGVRRPTSSLLPPFVRLVVSTIVPLGVGSPTRLRTAVEVITPPPQGPSAQVRVIVSRTVITYSAPSVPLAGKTRAKKIGERLCPCWRARRATEDVGLTKIIIEFESPPPK